MKMMRYSMFVLALVFIITSPLAQQASEAPKEAGEGDAKSYFIPSDVGIAKPFSRKSDYFTISLVSWYVNKRDNWRSFTQATGTVRIKANGQEFAFPIGSFTLVKGAKTAPLFNIPLVPTTPYDEKPITLQASLVGLKKNTPLGNLLQELASTAVSYAGPALGTLSLSGANPGLSQVSSSLTKTASSLVAEMGEKPIAIFDLTTGIQATLNREDLTGNGRYILLYKGHVATNLTIAANKIDVLENGQPLVDGAWVLFRVQREDIYVGERPWSVELADQLIDLKASMNSFKINPSMGGSLSAKFKITEKGDSANFGDRFAYIYNLIRADHALTEKQKLAESILVSSCLLYAKKAIAATNADIFFKAIALLEGNTNVTGLALNEVESEVEKQSKILKANLGTNFASLAIGPEFVSSVLNLTAGKQDRRKEIEESYQAFKEIESVKTSPRSIASIHYKLDDYEAKAKAEAEAKAKAENKARDLILRNHLKSKKN